MLFRGTLAGLVLCAAGLLAGCGGDDDASPFEGDWVSATAGRLSFDGSEWSDGDGDSGDFSYSGDYPEFTVRFGSDAGDFERVATFADEHTFLLCEPGANAADCHEFVYDAQTITPP